MAAKSHKPRVKAPKSASAGDIMEIKTLISHDMESGQRKDRKTGELIPRQIINKFECKYNGEVVFSVDMHPAISANPYLSFYVTAGESGELEFLWHDDNGDIYTHSQKLEVA
ncbi:thiosulfate oxidation carrier complex protein SoxZ [Phormidium willei BDU 130791]|nr:thiosulfate oxidation carrier complex protein SoxZ [Phormidium willei BDU 130791]